LACILLALGAAPSPATGGGVVTSFSSQPASTTAGGDPNVTTALAFSYAAPKDTVKNITVTLPPGLLAAPASVPQTCSLAQLMGSVCPAASEIGTSTATTSAGAATSVVFLMPPPTGNDVAGLGQTIYSGSAPVAYATGALDIAMVGGQPVGVIKWINVPNTVAGFSVVLNSQQLTIHGTSSNGSPFTRLPTSCGTATTTLSVDTYSAAGNGSGSDSFTPTGCSGLAYQPALSAAAARDAHDAGAQVAARITQAAGEAGNKSLTIGIPLRVIQPNPAGLAHPCADPTLATCTQVGSALASSPLLAAPLPGKVYLLGPVGSPSFVVAFPPPVAIRLVGAFDVHNGTVTFPSLPDVPISSLGVAFNGGPKAVFMANCSARIGTVTGSFTGQNGAGFNSNPLLTLTGCPLAPTASGGSLSGVAQGKAKLGFTLSAGGSTAKIKSFTVSLPGGLSFNSKHLVKGLSIKGAGKNKAKLQGGKLVVTLNAAASRVSVTIGGSGIDVSRGLASNVKKHIVKTLAVTTKVTDAAGNTTALSLKLNV
jgi:hypothetical protein